MILFLLSITIRATVLLTAAFLLSLLLRRAAAATRHAVWTTALAGVLLGPALVIAGPSWPWLPALTATVPDMVAATGMPSSSSAISGMASAAPPVAMTGTSLGAWPLPHPAWRLDVVLPVLWGFGATVLLVRLLASVLAVRRLTRHAERAGARYRLLLEQAAEDLDVAGRVRLLVSPDLATPIAWRGRRPLILLPSAAAGWDDTRIRLVLLHELGHVRRGDWFSDAVGRLAVALHWFNPLAWMAVRALIRERERACDDLVLTTGAAAPDYAQHLLEIARASADGPYLMAPAMAQGGELEGRLLAILTPRHRTGRRTVSAIIGLTGSLAAIAVAAAAPAAVQHREIAGRTAAPPSASPQPSSWWLVSEIAGSRRESTEPLTKLLDAAEDADVRIREEAAAGLAMRSDPGVLEPLLAALQDESAQVREKAAMGLVFRRDPRVVDALLDAAGDRDAQVREKVMVALGLSRDLRAIPALRAGATDPDAQVREKAVAGLGVIVRSGATTEQ